MSSDILVAFDESPQSTAALRHVLSTYPDTEIRVLHVNDPREWTSAAGMGGFYSTEMYEESRESGRGLLEEAEAIAREYDRMITTDMRDGQAARAIVRYAEEHDVDHVVLGSHGRRGLSRFLLGSIAETVARRAPESVTVIREPNPERR